MNPSASGWIPKFLTLVDMQQITKIWNDDILFYSALKSTGFLYGISMKPITNSHLSDLNITTEEFTKINLFHSLLYTFFKKEPKQTTTDAIKSIINFYNDLEKGRTSFLYKFSISKSHSDNLEHILSARLQESNSILKKNETAIIPYSLLFLDILTYKKYLNSENDIKFYEQELESNIINYCFLALKSKKEKLELDNQIIEQIESSSAYLTNLDHQNQFLDLEHISDHFQFNILERHYILDLCCLAIWNDKELDESEFSFLIQLINTLKLSVKDIENTIKFIKIFSEKHSKSIKLFQHNNPLNHLYKQATATVKLLIIRNKNRLTKELEESGELIKLLGQSTIRELNTEEKDKVKEQLLDICKTIPSLTIFLIPGGSLLLPLLVKYIPSLLPSSFQDNRINTKKDN